MSKSSGPKVVVVGVAAPFVFERWSERLFNPVGGEQSSADPSALTRFAETKAFITLLNAEPATYLYGRGLGATYYWDESYMPELAPTYDRLVDAVGGGDNRALLCGIYGVSSSR